MLAIRNLVKAHATPQGAVTVLNGVELTIARGETLALMGESGAGKSTLLHLIAGLDEADSGEITVEGVSVCGLDDRGRAALRRDRLGLVFQQFNLVPSLNVADNLAFQARLAGREDQNWTGELVERLGLGPMLNRYPEQLSGGQQQRVAIGRAMAARPALLLADEPTGALDEATADTVIALAREAAAAGGAAVLMATHSARMAAAMGRCVRLTGGRLSPAPAVGAAA